MGLEGLGPFRASGGFRGLKAIGLKLGGALGAKLLGLKVSLAVC